jgi:CBS domain-containing protein
MDGQPQWAVVYVAPTEQGGSEMPSAKDVMTTDVVTIDGMATARQAAETMDKKGVRALIVDRREPEDAYGIVTQRDIVYEVIAAGEDPDEILVHEIMSKPLVVVNPDLDVKYVARLMANMGLSRAPVIFGGKVQGIVSVSDVLKTLV